MVEQGTQEIWSGYHVWKASETVSTLRAAKVVNSLIT